MASRGTQTTDGLSWAAISRFLIEERGGSIPVEYRLIAVGVAAAVSGVVRNVGDQLQTNFYDRLATMFGPS